MGDRRPDELAASARMMAVIREVYELYGFEALETPFLEYTDALGKFLPDLDRPNEGVFSLKDDDEQWLSLRYDLTAPLARYVAENFDRLPKPYRSYRSGFVFRNEKPGPGRFRQFMQFDADTVGAAGVAADAEMCMMAADCMERLGIARGAYVIKVNNRKVLDGLMEALGLGGSDNVARRLVVLRAIDKLDRLGPDAVFQLLTGGRKDESGDFTKGADLSRAHADNVMRFLGFAAADGDAAYGADTTLRELGDDNGARLAWLTNNVELSIVGQEGLQELHDIAALALAAGYESDRILVDRAVVRGLEYYTGPVFEAELTADVVGEDGRKVRLGSLGGGGRYDGLVGRFRGDAVPATGFSVGMSRLFGALQALKAPIVTGKPVRGPVVVLVLDKDRVANYQAMVARLRDAGIAAELYLGASGMNAQLKYADRRRSACAVIQGSDERDHAEGPRVAIRDLVLGAELAASSKDRADYLELRQRAQFKVAEDELVDAVRDVLGRHPA